MAIRHVIAALSAAFLPLASSAADTVGADAPVVSIRADQYDRFISGASFVDRPDVWTNVNETWSASGGFSPRYWSGLEGVTLLPVYGSYEGPEMDRMHATHTACTFDRWSRRGQQPAVYGEIDGEGHYSSLYWGWDVDADSVRVVDVDRPACAPASCRLSADGPVAPEDGGDVFFDAQVAFEPFAYGEANRPTDVVTPDASLALYMQDTRPDGDGSPHLFVVSRDWDTGAIRHFDVGGDGLELNHAYQAGGGADRYCGRVVVRAMRTVHAGKSDPVVPAFMVYINRGYSYVYYNGTTGAIQWDRLRDDLGVVSWHGTSHSPFFRPLSAAPSLSLSRVSFGGGLTLGAYAVSRSNPLETTVRWTANSGMVAQLYTDGHAISDIDAGAWSMYLNLLGSYDLQRYPLDISWAGINGWSDGRFDSRPGGGCDVSLGPGCFPRGRASLSTMPADDEERAEELEQSLPARTGERIGNRYVEVPDALAHASVLGGTVTLLASPEVALAFPPLHNSVTVNLNDHTTYDGVSVSAAEGASPLFALSTPASHTSWIYGRLSASGVSLSVGPDVQFDGWASVRDAPAATLSGSFDSGVYVTNSALSVTGGHCATHNPSDLPVPPEALSNVSLRVVGGSLSISGGTVYGIVSAEGVSPVSITGGTVNGIRLDGSTLTMLGSGAVLGGELSVSNNALPLVVAGHVDGQVRVSGATNVTVAGSASVYGDIHVERAASFVLERGKEEHTGTGMQYNEPYIGGSAVTIIGTPAALYGGFPYNGGAHAEFVGGPVLLDGFRMGHYNGTMPAAYSGVPSVTISNSPSAVIASGAFCGSNDRQYSAPHYVGTFRVYDSPVEVRGGELCDFSASGGSTVVISNAPAMRGAVSVSATESIAISGGTFGPDSLRDYSKGYSSYATPPTVQLDAPDVHISGGTFRATLAGSGIKVSGGTFYWGPNRNLDESGVVVLADGKKLVRVGGGDPYNAENMINTYWEVRNK